MFWIILTLIIFIVSTFLLLSILVSLLRTGVPTLASAKAAHKQIADYLASKNVRTVYELGSGKGDFVFSLAKYLPRARVAGIELSPAPYLFAKLRLLFSSNKDRIDFMLMDFHKVDLSQVDAVAFYLMPGPNKRIKPKLIREMKAGATVASVSFTMPGWQPTKILRAHNFSKTHSYIYEIPQNKNQKNHVDR